jgi:hypothetical protein
MEKYPIYKVDFNADIHSAHGLFGISLVNRPAIESDFIYMSEQQEDYKFSSDDKMEIVGAMMIPDKLIFRKREDQKFYLYFSKDDISAIVEKMSIDGFNNYFTIEHEYAVDGVYLKEIWIKEFEQDKSNEYGFSAPVGTAFCKLKVANEAVWQEVKSKGLKGLSIELKTDIKMEEKEKINFSIEDFANQMEKLTQTVERLSEAVEMFKSKAEPSFGIQSEVVVSVQEPEQPIAVEQMAEVVEETPTVVEAKEEVELEFVVEENKSEQEIEQAVEELLSEQTETVELASQEPKVITRDNVGFFSLLDKIYK